MAPLDWARFVCGLASLGIVVAVHVLQLAGKGQLGITAALCVAAWGLLRLAEA